MRFRPEQHLRRQSDFRTVREQGHRINCGAFTFWCLQRQAAGVPAESPVGVPAAPLGSTSAAVRRLGVVASTASVGNAVRRARAKRRLRELFRQHQQAVPAGCDILLTARAAAVELPMHELEQKFMEACRKAAPRQND